MTNREILEAQSQQVVIGNELIQKSRYSLTKQEQKILLFMVSKIKPLDEPDTEYIFSYREFEEVCNLNTDGGYYEGHNGSLTNSLITLKSKPLEIPLGEKRKLISSWFNDAIIDDEKKIVRISFSKYLRPYLFYLQECFTQFTYQNVLPMRSQYSIRLYEYLKSIYNMGHKQIKSVDEIKERIDNNNELYGDFKRRALLPALKEINTYTELKVEYKELKTGKKITDIEFTIMSNEPVKAHINRMRALGQLQETKE